MRINSVTRVLENQDMIQEIKGIVSAGTKRYAIVVSRFNEFITSKLLGGAIDCLQRHGATDEQICVVWVPGACEIAQAARKLASCAWLLSQIRVSSFLEA